MNILGWILIILLVLVIGVLIFAVVYYFVKIRPDEDQQNGPTGPTGPPPPAPEDLSIVTTAGKPIFGVTNDTNNNVILLDPTGPTGPTGATGANPDNICSHYTWTYGGGTGTIGPVGGGTGATGPTGSAAVVTGGTGGFVEANWETNQATKFLRVNSTTPAAGDAIVTGATGPTGGSEWIFVPESTSANKGKWCLRNVTDKLLCLHYTGIGASNQQLTLKEFRINNTADVADKGFVFGDPIPLTSDSSPPCNVG